jgi:putative spermidine/putrescine transport system ATP-binding protein
VEIDHLVNKYQDKTVLNGISLQMKKGEFVTLLGESGCGKSTLLRIIAGITDLESGSIKVNNREITNLPTRKREVGMVFQSYALFPNMTVFQNISYGLKLRKIKNYQKQVADMLEMVGLKGFEDRYPRELSGGQQQRVALARSLVMKPDILLLDEPFSALDAKIRKVLQEEIKMIQRELNMTTIFVTHDQKEAMVLSDRIFIMNKGRIEQVGTPEEIYLKPKNRFVASFIGSYNILSKEELQSVVQSEVVVSSSAVAIRPESIKLSRTKATIEQQEENYQTVGIVQTRTITGNVISYQILMGNEKIQVDKLYQSIHHFQEGEEVFVSIPKEACVEVN